MAKRRKNNNRKLILVYLPIIIGLLILLLTLIQRSDRIEPIEETANIEPKPVIEEETAVVRPEVLGSIYIVIDDVGHNLTQLEPFLELDVPITFAILPFLSYSGDAAEKIEEHGKKYLIHAPMEPLNGEDPGPGALYIEMSPSEIEESTNAMLKNLSGAEGINNHMGSRFTSDIRSMDSLLKTLNRAGKFYLDSYTTADSVAREVSLEYNMSYFRRDIFVDNAQDEESMRVAIREGFKVAKEQGHAILIGHVWSEALPEILSEMYLEGREQKFEFGNISSLYSKEKKR